MKKVLLVSIGYAPNVGGIETHFTDLVTGLVKHRWNVTVLTYQPLTSHKKAPFVEHHQSVDIYRVPLFRGLFYKLVHTPILEFLYLTPGLFFSLPFVLITQGSDIQVIHSHGLVAGFVSVFWGKIFNKRVITTTHSLYEFPSNGLYRKFATWIFTNSAFVLCLSDQSVKEIVSLGVRKEKVKRFVYWVDSKRFHPINDARKKLSINSQFVVLFVGRLVSEKGVEILLRSTKKWPKNTRLIVAGLGPLAQKVIKYSQKYPTKITYAGKLRQDELPQYYSAANIFIIPSTNEEGFGRVIIESLMCGTPVIGSNKGAIPEAMNDTVGVLIQPTSHTITKTIKHLMNNKEELKQMEKKARPFALRRYSEENIDTIISTYTDGIS